MHSTVYILSCYIGSWAGRLLKICRLATDTCIIHQSIYVAIKIPVMVSSQSLSLTSATQADIPTQTTNIDISTQGRGILSFLLDSFR